MMPRRLPDRVASVDAPSTAPLRALWRGEREDRYGEYAVVDTTAAALMSLENHHSVDSARTAALSLWQNRNCERLK